MIGPEKEALYKQVSATLLELSKRANAKEVDFDTFLEYSLKCIAGILKSHRVGFWYYEEAEGLLCCAKSIQLNAAVPTAVGTIIRVKEHDNYFQALKTQRVVSIKDAQTDPRTKGFMTVGYLERYNVRATLDTQIYCSNTTLAVLCVEEMGSTRSWHYLEQHFLASVGELLGQAYSLSQGRQLRQQLKASERQYRYLFEHNPSPLVIYDLANLRLLGVNKACTELLDYKQEDLLGSVLSNYMDIADLKAFNEAVENGQMRYSMRTGPWCIIGRGEKRRWVEAHSHKIRFLDRACRVVLLHDITEQEEAKQALRNNLNALENVRRAISNSFLMLMTDVDGRIEEANDAFCQHFSYGLKELYKKKASSLTDREKYTFRFWKEVRTTLERTGFWAGELCLRSNQGEGHWLVVYLNAILNQEGKLENILALMYPIDERKKVEEERDELIDTLIARNQRLRTFTHLTSHHIRSPISRLLGLMDLMDCEGRLSKEEEQVWSYIQQSVRELDTIVSDLNSVLEIQAEEYFGEVDLSELFIASRHLLGKAIEKVKPQIELKLKRPKVVSIPSFIENIFFQLMENAIKFRHPERQLKLCISSFEEDSDRWELYFEDNGMGIDMKRYEGYLFQMYQRFHPWVPGKGLGLFTIKRQMEMLGGRISLTSELNEGTRIQLSFPKEKPYNSFLERS